MNLIKITLVNFKNHEELSVHSDYRMNGFVGPNGIGKTNLLEAIYYGLTGLPYFHRSDRFNVKKGAEKGAIRLTLRDNDEETTIAIKIQPGGKKEISVNGNVLDRIMDHIGNFPAVMIAPGDIELITGGSEERRRFLDRSISLGNKDYLKVITRYNRLLDSRNKQLKQFFEQRYFDEDLLHVIDMQLAPLSDEIFESRKKYLKKFIPLFKKYYEKIEGGSEPVEIYYESELTSRKMSSSDLLKSNREADRFQQRTTSGIHKDDLIFTLDDNPLKRYGSQGQIKTFLIALNLATFDMIQQQTGHKPFLLLDDIFEKIDHGRAERLLSTIHTNKFGQVFVTDTDKSRVDKATTSYLEDRHITSLSGEEQSNF